MIEFGKAVAALVLSAASLLREAYVPGLVCVGLVFLLVVALVWYSLRTGRNLHAIGAFIGIVARTRNADEFHRDYVDISRNLHALEDRPEPRGRLGAAWREYAETLEESSSDGCVHNSVRPSVYFNREDLGIEDGFWRHVPALFVSVGLLLTFLGLVAALDAASGTLRQATGDSSTGVTGALMGLLSVASAKFIMSLTGLACSILFTLALRVGTGWTDHRLLRLCNEIEKRVRFRTPEWLLAQMLTQQTEQTEQMKGLLPELVAQLGRPLEAAADRQTERMAAMESTLSSGLRTLNEGVPAAIEKSMQPILQRLEDERGAGARQIADGLSERLTASVKDVLDGMGATMTRVGDSLTIMAERMDRSSGIMTGQVDAAVTALAGQIDQLRTQMAASAGEASKVLNDGADRLLTRMGTALEAIQENTARGGESLERAAGKLQAAAAEMADTIMRVGATSAEAAGQTVRDVGSHATEAMGAALGRLIESLQGSMSVVESQAGRFADAFRGDLLTPLEELRVGLDRWREAVQGAASQSQRHADAVAGSAAAVELANGEVTAAARGLSEATAPMAAAAVRIEASNQELQRTLALGTKALEAALAAVREPQRAMLACIESLEQAVEEFSDIVEACEDIDRSLGQAFERIRDGVQQSVQEIGSFSDKLNRESANALSTLQAVVTQIEPYLGPKR